jgi:hypothetical protein
MKPCILCKSKDELIAAKDELIAEWKRLFYDLDARLTKATNSVEWLIKEAPSEVCYFVGANTDNNSCGMSGIKCGSGDCHAKLFTALIKRGEG